MTHIPTVWLDNLPEYFEYMEWEITSSRYGSCFRGERWGSKTPLQPTADRSRWWHLGALKANGKTLPDKITGIPFLDTKYKTFASRLSLYHEPWYPKDANFLESLSLINHYGGVTPLLDLTRSFAVATHFAIHRKGDYDRCIWGFSDYQFSAHRFVKTVTEATDRIGSDTIDSANSLVKEICESLQGNSRSL